MSEPLDLEVVGLRLAAAFQAKATVAAVNSALDDALAVLTELDWLRKLHAQTIEAIDDEGYTKWADELRRVFEGEPA